MIELIPAIDIIGGKCVRLSKGDYNQKTVYGDDPASIAKRFEDIGFKRLHVVDLDGAKSKHIVNAKTLNAIASVTSLTIDFGGGIKTEDDIKTAFDNGASMVTVGSVTVTSPDTCLEWIDRFGADKIILGADVRNGNIAVNGWLDETKQGLMPYLDFYSAHGIKNVLCTEISKDGMLCGPATGLYKQIMAAHPTLHLIASGGVSSIDDIKELDNEGIPAVVFGKAIYEGKINLNDLWDWQNG